MNKKFNDLVDLTKSQDRVKIIEYTNKVPELMNISIGVITKPGGLTVTESLVSHLPIVIINPIPGQEEENADFLVNNGVALWIKKGDNIARSLKELSRDEKRMKNMAKKAKELAKPYATSDICNILMNQFEDVVKIPNKIIVSILIKHKNKYLFINQNKKDSTYKNCLRLVGGAIENNETLEESIKRKISEEVNILIDKVTPFDFDSDIVQYKGRKTQLIFLRYTAEIDDETASLIMSKSDAKEIVWLSKNELLDYKHNESTLRFLKKLKLI